MSHATKQASQAEAGAARVGSGGLVLHEGRWVSSRWYSRYILGVKPPKPRRREPILALFHMPANPWALEPAETRLMNLVSKPDVRWIVEMSACYSVMRGRGSRPTLTTFFPALENVEMSHGRAKP